MTQRILMICALWLLAAVGCVNQQPLPPSPTPPVLNLKLDAPGNIPALSKAHFLQKANTQKSLHFCMTMASLYETEARLEGINSDIAFAQMCLETGFLRFGGTVLPEQNNFCGLGTVNSSTRGAYFSQPWQGIRAHIQHLKAYANQKPLLNPQIDPRFHLVKRGSAPYVEDLTGKWATDPEYDKKILSLLFRLLRFHIENPDLKPPQYPGLPTRYQNQAAEYRHQAMPRPRSFHEQYF